MLGKQVENIDQIRAYINVFKNLGHSVKQIFNELGSYETVRRWRMKVLTGTKSVRDAAKSHRHVTVLAKTNVSKVREIMESDGRYIHDP
jgi:hypothetical protein